MSTKAIMQSHWVAFVFLLPAVIMLILHQRLGLSDALNVPTPSGEREAHLFNWVMVMVFWIGIAAFSLHALSLCNRGWSWIGAKLVVLAIYWGLMLKLS